MIGPPASGKSTTRQDSYPSHRVIDPDEIKTSLPGYDPKNPSRVHLLSKKIARQEFEESVKEGTSFVYDTTGGNTERMIREMAEARAAGFTITLLRVHAPLKTCLRRNRERERTVPDEVVREIWYEVQEAWEILYPLADQTITVDTSSL